MAVTLVDAADRGWLSRWRWTLHPAGYAYRGSSVDGKRCNVYMHRVLLGLERGDKRRGDHINMDPLDNRRSNLRIVTKDENEQNRRSYRGSTSRFRGVWLDKKSGRWIAEARLDNKKHCLGSFVREEDAGRAASDWRREHMPFSSDARAAA